MSLDDARGDQEAQRLRELFEEAPGLISVVRGPDHVFEFVNRAYRRLIGERDYIGRPAREVLPELAGQGYFALLDQVYESGQPYVGERAPSMLPGPDGKPEERFINFVYQPIRGPAGDVTGIFAEGIDVTDAVRAEASRRVAERRLDAVLNNASVSIFLMDDRQQCIYMNAAAERLTGFRFEETTGRPLHDVIHHTRPDGSHFPLQECAIDRAFPTNNNVQGEEVFVHKDGHFYPVAFTASPIRDEDSKTVGTIIEVRDISAEKGAEAALLEARQTAESIAAEQQAVVQQLAEGVIVADATGRITFINQAAAELHGMERTGIGPAEYSSTYGLFTEEGAPYPPEELPLTRAALEGETINDARWRIRRPDGSEVLAIGGARPIVAESGVRIGAVLTLRDDTERRRAEAALEEEQRILDTLNRTGAAVAGELDLHKVVQIVIDAGVAITGAEFGAFFYNTIRADGEAYMLYALSGADPAAFSNYEMPRATQVFQPTFQGAGVIRSDDITKDPRYGKMAPHHGMPPGHLPVHSYLAVSVVSRSGEVVGGLFFGHKETAVFGERHERMLIGIAAQAAIAIDNARLFEAAQRELDEKRRAEQALRDLNQTLEDRVAQAIAERERVEEALRQAQKMEAVGQLTGGIAHDFNNLLTVVAGNIDMARRSLGEDGDPRALRAIGNAMKGADRAASLTQRLLAFSRRQPLQPKQVDVNRTIAGMSELLDRALGETVSLETVAGAGLWRVEVDPHQLESAILNLAVNARDAMPGGGKLTVETSNCRIDESYAAGHADVAPGQYVLIAVSDTGTGMAPDVLAKAWDPFFSTKEVGKGTGLGLSQVYGYVKQSGGHVKIYSEIGHGTTVKIYLPRLMADIQADEEVREEAPEPAPGEENILVVEDDDDVRIYTVESLRELGYRVLEAHDGASALRLLERQETPVSLLLTDVVMPGMSGRELADEALAMYPDLKVLFTTGYARNAIVHGGRLDPGVELLPKPFTFEALAAKVRDVLEMSSSERVLVLAADDGTRARFATSIEEVGLAADVAATRVEALGRLKAMVGGYAAVVIAGDVESEASIAALRAERQDLPIVVESSDDPEELRQAYAGDRCLGVIRAPATGEELRHCLRELRVRCEGASDD